MGLIAEIKALDTTSIFCQPVYLHAIPEFGQIIYVNSDHLPKDGLLIILRAALDDYLASKN